MKSQLLLIFVLFLLPAAFTYAAPPPKKVVEQHIREVVERDAALAIFYGAEGTGIVSIAIVKETTEKMEDRIVHSYYYEVLFRTVPKIKGEKKTENKITGRTIWIEEGDRYYCWQ